MVMVISHICDSRSHRGERYPRGRGAGKSGVVQTVPGGRFSSPGSPNLCYTIAMSDTQTAPPEVIGAWRRTGVFGPVYAITASGPELRDGRVADWLTRRAHRAGQESMRREKMPRDGTPRRAARGARIGSAHDGVEVLRQDPMRREPPGLSGPRHGRGMAGSGAGRAERGKRPCNVSGSVGSGDRYELGGRARLVPHGPEVAGSDAAVTGLGGSIRIPLGLWVSGLHAGGRGGTGAGTCRRR